MDFKDLLIVVDAQNDFLLPTGKLFIGHDTTEYRKRLGEFVHKFPGDRFATRDSHPGNSVEFEMFPEHCIDLSNGWQLIKEINIYKFNKVFDKSSYNSHEISSTVASMKKSVIYVVGVCISICVHDIIVGIINEAKNTYNQTPKIKIIRNLVDDFDPEMAEFSLKRLQKLYGVEIIE